MTYADKDLLGIGILGSVQNFLAASVRRSSSALGLHLKQPPETISHKSVAEALKIAETKHEFLGTALLDVFYPGTLRVKEGTENMSFWRAAMAARYAENNHGIRIDRLPGMEDEISSIEQKL